MHVQSIGFNLQHNIKQNVVVHSYPGTQEVKSGSQKFKVILGEFEANLGCIRPSQKKVLILGTSILIDWSCHEQFYKALQIILLAFEGK